MAKTTPTESQIRVVMSDWLGNLRQKDEGNYIHRGKGGIRTARKGTMTDYLIGDVDSLDELELIKRSRMAAEQVVNAVVNEPAVIQVGPGGSWHTTQDGRHEIRLATDYFDDPDLSAHEKADIMLGLAAHEAAHGAYTETDAIEGMLKGEKGAFADLKHQIWNVIEDERIEFLLGDERPGLAASIGATKGYYFKKLLNNMKTSGQMPTEPLPKLLAALTQAVRYPSEMTREQVEENFDELNEIRRILTPYPLTSEGAWDAAARVMEVVRKLAKDEAKKQKEQQDGTPGSGEEDGNGGNSSSPSSQDKSSKGKDPKGSNPTKAETDDALRKMLSTEQAKNVLQALKQDDEKGDPSKVSQAINNGCNSDKNLQYVNQDDAELSSGGPGNPRQYVFKPKGDQGAYLSALSAVRAYIPAMSKVLSCKGQEVDYELHGLPSGRLNTNRLVAFRAGNRNIFDKQGTVTCSSASVVMLIDESGSMSGNREQRAREAAILINEAIARIPNVNFYCYGYTSEELCVYAENGRTSKWALSATSSKGGTPTGLAMKLASERVRRFTSDPVLMLVLTDGAPDSSKEVIEQDRELRTKKFHPIGIGIQSNAVSRTFKDYVVMNDISTLAVDLGRMTKKILNSMLVRTDSND